MHFTQPATVSDLRGDPGTARRRMAATEPRRTHPNKMGTRQAGHGCLPRVGPLREQTSGPCQTHLWWVPPTARPRRLRAASGSPRSSAHLERQITTTICRGWLCQGDRPKRRWPYRYSIVTLHVCWVSGIITSRRQHPNALKIMREYPVQQMISSQAANKRRTRP